MTRLLLPLLLCLLSLPALAGELRVTIVVAAGDTPIEYRLTEADSRLFWRKLNQLPQTENMVPLANTSSNYNGLMVRDTDKNREIRINSGIVRQNEKSRTDDFRMLERWLLTLAPPPLGPALVAALDSEVGETAEKQGAVIRQKMTAQQIVLECRARGKNNQRLRAQCLEEYLKTYLDMKDYADALERIAGPQGPPGLSR